MDFVSLEMVQMHIVTHLYLYIGHNVLGTSLVQNVIEMIRNCIIPVQLMWVA